MATREERLSEFNIAGTPAADQPVELLCEDKSGTYTLPFACRWSNGGWINIQRDVPIEGTVVGWRAWES